MKHNRISPERQPYNVKGNYLKCFGHLYKPDTMSKEFRKRMEDLAEEDARYYKAVSNHYKNERK